MKKVLGVFLYVVAIVLTLAFIGQFDKFLAIIISLFKIFSTELNGYQRGLILGSFFYWIIHFTIIYFAFKYGSKFFNNKSVEKIDSAREH